ncbi:hypothetical protein PAESOLCIP111_01932 [Paenibacillus solanacearum]|uniref:Uncharacterized protein n=1 Tax=Paenibacillus solanacearum TaxID=2048548 RepID=A0A916NPQ6_9BACL|nr:hypothetical protein PAESOLCIP111_01932 [Paenibacillus solanacearum]
MASANNKVDRLLECKPRIIVLRYKRTGRNSPFTFLKRQNKNLPSKFRVEIPSEGL